MYKIFQTGLILSSFTSLWSMDSFPYDPPPNFSLVLDQGIVRHPTTTSTPVAQDFFDQGFTFLYAFNHDAAYWSFKKASEIDPSMAMAYWGMALAMGPNINMPIPFDREQKAYQLVQQALKLSGKVTDNEKAYIQALAVRYSNNPDADHQKLAQSYKRAMKSVVDRFPDDLDAAALYAESALDTHPWNQWDEKGDPLEGTLPIVVVLESILKRNPDHLGGNHYYIHAVEASRNPERALMSAERLRRLLPASGHILHMPSHIYILVGDYHLAAICNEEAAAIDRAYIHRYGMDGIYPLHYLSHNLYFLARAYSMEGRYDDALYASKQLEDFYNPHYDEMPGLEYYIPTSLFVFLRFHRWQDILNVPRPKPSMQITEILWHFARSMAFASLGNISQAEEEQTFFLKGKKGLALDAIYGYNKAQDILTIADFSLKSKMADVQNNPLLAIHFLKQAVDVQDKLHYNEPPDWFFPIRESLGGALLRSKQFLEAEQVFRDDLEKHPRNGRSLFGLLKSLEAQSRFGDAFWIRQAFEHAWRYSTTSLNISDL